ncbi:MAG: hypothetical protein A2077_07165 [Nitrospirae bacterium GWC2_46_6]|nr:MAG: hypothetical protein A2077_07165 [Nitrospirae bacterium GWC2_46_6]
MIGFHLKKIFTDFSVDIGFSDPSRGGEREGRGHLTVLFGPSGTGKSLILNMLSGIITPDDGYIWLNGDELFNREKGINVPMRKRKIGFVFQEYSLFPHFTVAENIVYGINSKADPKKKLGELLELFRLNGKEEKYPRELSGGQKQRVAIARAIASDPKLLLLDEPLSALDERIREKLQQDLLKLKSFLRIPVIYVTHNLQEAFTLADHIIVVNDGSIVESGEKEMIFLNPRKRLTAKFLGVKNIFPCTVAETSENYFICDFDGIKVKTNPDSRFNEGDKAFLCIKPPDIRLIINDKQVDNIFEVTVSHVIPLEKTQRIFLKFPRTRFNLIMDLEKLACEKWKIELGDKVKVSMRKDRIFLAE